MRGKIVVSMFVLMLLLTACNTQEDKPMTAKFQILAPEATRNLIRNPNAEKNLDYWRAHGSVIDRSSEEARFGWHSVEVVTNGAGLYEGTSVRSYPNSSGITYAASAYVRGSGSVRLRLRDETNGDEFVSDAVSLNVDKWIRISDIIGSTGRGVEDCDDLRIYIETDRTQAITFYVDGAQIEEKPYSTTYIDGDQPGGRWNIAKHASVSDRDAQEATGGRWIDLDEVGLGVYATVTGGIGMPPLSHNVQGRSLEAGVEYQSTKVLSRVIQLTLWTKSENASPGALERLHESRQNLIDIIKPDRVSPTQPIRLRYNGGDTSLEIDALYEGGLEFSGDVRNQYFNSFVVRFFAPDPFWFEDNQHIETLDPLDSLPIQNGLIAKINREWTDLGLVNNFIIGSAIGPDGNYYVAGRFTTIGGVGANGIAYWDGENWNPLGTGLNMLVAPQPAPNGIIIAFGPDGSLYAGGNFNDAGGVAGTQCLARWDFDTNTWNSVGGGVNNPIYSMGFSPNGSLFIVGMFTQADPAGVPIIVNNIAEWTGAAWNQLIDTNTGINGLVPAGAGGAGLEVAVGPNNIVYIGGAFTSAANVADTDSIAYWDPNTDEYYSIGGSADNDVGSMAITSGGNVYIGGVFTDIGGVSLNRAAVWNGTAWSQLAGGVNGRVRWIFIAEDNLVWFVGDFTQALDSSGVAIPNTDHISIWDGSQWIPPQFTAPPNLTRMRTLTVSGEDLYFAGEGAIGTAFISVPNSFDSLATAESYPIFRFERTGGTNAVIIMILNEGTRKQMKLTYEMSDGEVVIIDTRPGYRTVESSLFAVNIDVASALRNQLGKVIPGSDFATLSLRPGENNISVYVQPIGDPVVESWVIWKPLHWSADAVRP